MVAKQDVTARMWLVLTGGLLKYFWLVSWDDKAGGGSGCSQLRIQLPAKALG